MRETNTCRYCAMPHGSSSLWCSHKCQEADTDRQRAAQALTGHLSTAECCVNCEYEGTAASPCQFPDPQKGGEPPFMTQAAMPDPSNLGVNCMQFRKASNTGA